MSMDKQLVFLLACASEEAHELSYAVLAEGRDKIVEELADLRALAELLNISRRPMSMLIGCSQTDVVLSCASFGRVVGKALRFGMSEDREDQLSELYAAIEERALYFARTIDTARVLRKKNIQRDWALKYSKGEVLEVPKAAAAV